MSHFYTGSSDYTNGGNVQKIFCMAYGTSAAICASFHKNWQWRSWWSVVTAKNTARPETEGEREGDGGGREGGSNASIALLAGLDSSLHSFWCSNYKEKKERERKRNEDQRGEERGNKEKLRPCLRRSTCDCFFFSWSSVNNTTRRHVTEVLEDVSNWSSLDSLLKGIFKVAVNFLIAQRKEKTRLWRCMWNAPLCSRPVSGQDVFDWQHSQQGLFEVQFFALEETMTAFFAFTVARLWCLNDCTGQIFREDMPRWKQTARTPEGVWHSQS